MRLLHLITLAVAVTPAAAIPRLVSSRHPVAKETVSAQEVSQEVAVSSALPDTGGQDLVFSAASLFLLASVLAYALLRRRRHL